MGIFGKILAVFNVLAVAAFFYLTTADWTRRQVWAIAAYKHDLVVEGLPLDEEERDSVENLRLVDKLPEKSWNEVYKDRGLGLPFRTQEEEVKDILTKYHAQIDRAATDDEKRKLLRVVLVPQVRTGEERDAMVKRCAEAPVPDLLADLDRNFELAIYLSKRETVDLIDREIKDLGKLSSQGTQKKIALLGFLHRLSSCADEFPELADFKNRQVKDSQVDEVGRDLRTRLEGIAKKIKPSDQASKIRRAPAQRRKTIAHLLVNLSQDQVPGMRLLLVIGLKAFAEEANQQAEAYREMAVRVRKFMSQDRAGFEVKHNEIIKDLVNLSTRLEDLKNELNGHKDLKLKHEALTRKQEDVVKDLKNRLEAARVATQKALAGQRNEERLLFNAQAAVGKGQAENERLAKDIKKLEDER